MSLLLLFWRGAADVAPSFTSTQADKSAASGATTTLSWSADGTPAPTIKVQRYASGSGLPTLLGFQSITSGANALTVPAGTQGLTLSLAWWDAGATFSSVTSTGWATLAANMTSLAPDPGAPFKAGTCKGHGPVTATGAQTLTLTLSEAVDEGPAGFVMYWGDVNGSDFVVDSDTVRNIAASSVTATLDTVADCVLIAVEMAANTGAIPADAAGWTTLSGGTYTNNLARAKIRTKNTVATPTDTASTEAAQYHSLQAFSVKGISAGWLDVTTGTNFTGSSPLTYTTPTLTLADNGSQWRAVATNTAGSVNSAAMTLTVGGAITGTASTSQAQTTSATGTASAPSITGAASTSQAQTGAAAGTVAAPSVTGTAATSHAQTAQATGTVAAPGINGVVSTAQAQTTQGTGNVSAPGVTGVASTSQAQTAQSAGVILPPGVAGAVSTSQAQRTSASGTFTPAAITGTAATQQAQTTAGVGLFTPAAITGVAATRQAQTAIATGLFPPAGITGVATTSQAQTTLGSGAVTGDQTPPLVSGGFSGFGPSRAAKARKQEQDLDALRLRLEAERVEKEQAQQAQEAAQADDLAYQAIRKAQGSAKSKAEEEVSAYSQVIAPLVIDEFAAAEVLTVEALRIAESNRRKKILAAIAMSI